MSTHTKSVQDILGRDPVHPFPARMAPGIALEVLEAANRPLRVLDPMMGSGTVLAVARAKGHWGVGIDIDPLAVLIARVWTTAIDIEEVRDKASDVLARAKAMFDTMPDGRAYPQNADEDTRQFTRYWFDPYARGQLAALATAIGRVRSDPVRDVLWCGFSRLIVAKQAGASLAMDLSHSRPHKSFERAPTKPFRKFTEAVDRVVRNCITRTTSGRGPAPSIQEGDARDLRLKAGSIDLVLTSPPYLNAIDYMRCSKFSLVWMGHGINDLRALRTDSVGSEAGSARKGDEDTRSIVKEMALRPRLSARHEAILTRYIEDMRSAVREVHRVLSPGGTAVYVVGENTVRGTFIRNSLIVSAIGELCGLRLRKRRVRMLPRNRRYLPPPVAARRSATLDGRMRREVVLAFSKPAA